MTADQPLLIVGAGFNIDANSLVQSSEKYPLVADLLRICFGRDAMGDAGSIEDLFQGALDLKDREPIRKLVAAIQAADHYVAAELARSTRESLYHTVLRRFEGSDVLTFNYDNLVELILFHEGRWSPGDGFGVPVTFEVHHGLVQEPDLPERSAQRVLHLHGSASVYASEYQIRRDRPERLAMIEARPEPVFVFDPDVVASDFFPIVAPYPTTGYSLAAERVIAPIPSKASALAQPFIRATYGAAKELLSAASHLVFIGYSFNPSDEASYDPLVRDFVGKALVVAPDANESVARLAGAYPGISWKAFGGGMQQWSESGFRGAA